MWNSDYTPALSERWTAHKFPGTPVTVYLGEKPETVHLGSKSDQTYEGFATFENAFWVREENYTVIYTEHLGYFVFFTDTVLEVKGQQGPSLERNE